MSSPIEQALRGGIARPAVRAAYLGGRGLGYLRRASDRLAAAPPWAVLACLVVADWLVTVEAARIALHRGFLYYDGGDGTWYYTTAWVLAHGHVPLGAIGYGYSMLIAPITWIAGPNLLAGLPYVIVLNAVIFAPLALVALYGLARAVGGRLFAYATCAIWVALPLLAIAYFYSTYHMRYVDVTLPPFVGLTTIGDYPSMVCLLVAAYFAYRALSGPGGEIDGLSAGLAAGIAIGIKPANALFLVAALCALALARRPRPLIAFVVGLAPSLLALALWKYRGLGHLPVLSLAQTTVAGGVRPGGPVGSLPIHFGHYLHFNFTTLKDNLDGLREWGWSKRLVEWLTLAGLVGLARRSIAGAVLVGGWFAAYLVVKGGDPIISFGEGNFLTHLIAALPAWVLLCCCVVFCLPVYGRRPLRAPAQSWPASRRARRGIVALLTLLAVLPIGVIAILPVLTNASAADLPFYDLYVPTNRFALNASARAGTVSLRWPAQQTHGAQATYYVMRVPAGTTVCTLRVHAAVDCEYEPDIVAIVPSSETAYRDRPGPGSWTYSVALAANAYGPRDATNPLLLSRSASVSVG